MKIFEKIKLKLRAPLRPIIRVLLFYIYDTYYVIGSAGKLKVGTRCALSNAYFNLSSGNITIGDNTIFSPNVMVITGRHKFKNGQRASLVFDDENRSWGGGPEEVPENGYDITIGKGVWIAAGVIISGNVIIGDNVIVGANSVVTRDIPDYSIVMGSPAKIVGDTRNH